MAMEVSMMQLGMLGTNCYLLKDTATGKGALIDPGGQAEVIEKVLTERGVELESVFLTHAHYDHTGAVADLLKAHPGLKVYLHDADAALGEDKAAMMPDAHLRTHGYGEGDTVTVGETALTVLHTPGHTPGGVCLVCGDLLFSGDTLIRGSKGRTAIPGGALALAGAWSMGIRLMEDVQDAPLPLPTASQCAATLAIWTAWALLAALLVLMLLAWRAERRGLLKLTRR